MLSFCKSCSNLNTYVSSPERKLTMKCSSCGRPDDDIKENCVYFNKFVQSSYDAMIDPDQCYDPTLPNTDQIPCVNAVSCPSNNPGYMIFVQQKQAELFDEMVNTVENVTPDQVTAKFQEMGGATGQWILDAWSALPEAQRKERNEEAVKQGITSSVLPRIVFFHYNKDLKLAYICALCRTFWYN